MKTDVSRLRGFNFDIAVETAQDLEASFTWKPPPSTETRDADDHLAGPESISPNDVAAEFAALKELKRTK
ncbi:hypothetical protein F4604DRAFT_1916281 [Suillus subluteus]|nr:hypothetical protein F4604DRAFT_1916281 [Suillus subluteus]